MKKPITIGVIALVLLIPLGGSNFIQQSYASTDVEEIELELQEWEKVELDKSDILSLKINAINNGKTATHFFWDNIFLVDSQKRTFGSEHYLDLSLKDYPITRNDCPSVLYTTINPGLSAEEILCYEIPKVTEDSYSLELCDDSFGNGCIFKLSLFTPTRQSEPEPEPEPTCGSGTQLVNGLCEVIKTKEPEPVRMGFYENGFYDYSFEMPMNWGIMENVDSGNTKGMIIQTLIFPEGFTPRIKSTPMIEVHFLNIPKSEVVILNAKNLEEYQREMVIELLPYARIIESGSEKTDWGWKVTVESKFENLRIIDTLFVFSDRESYTVGYVALEDDYFELYKPVYENIISSLQIKDIKVSEHALSFLDPPSDTSSEGGGCLIATATYGSELAPQVQNLRELRDNKLLQTESGSAFIESFNDFYYSFSPVIADYERENPYFKEGIKLAITPMISSLSILNYVELETDGEVLSYGISLILLNVGMYVGVPLAVVIGIRKNF